MSKSCQILMVIICLWVFGILWILNGLIMLISPKRWFRLPWWIRLSSGRWHERTHAKESLRTGGILLIGEPYWVQMPPTEDVAKGCSAGSISDYLMLPELLASFGELGYDVVFAGV